MSDSIETLYTDGVQVGCQPFGVTLCFTVSPLPGSVDPKTPKIVADIRMSPEHAKVLAIVLRRQIQDFERQLGKPIPILPAVVQQLGLSPTEDW
jgi:hypothetical protein